MSCSRNFSLIIFLFLYNPVAIAAEAIGELDILQLMDMEMSTESRKTSPISRTAAAAYIITRDDIRRSGATSIPEALRLAPGVSARQIGPSEWSVSIRGFDGRFAPKLLVLIDGRSVYTPTFGGTYWSMQDVLLEDIERIEVVRGPGAALWGANAVNGVINIITRPASKELGSVAVARIGSQEHSGGLRWTSQPGSDLPFRGYVKSTHGDSFENSAGFDQDDDFSRHQAGFRSDWLVGERDQFSVHGDVQRLDQSRASIIPDPLAAPDYNIRRLNKASADSYNLVGRWQRSLAVDSEFSLQVYYDHYDREDLVYLDRRDTLDVDFQHQFGYGTQQQLIWGFGYRVSNDEVNTLINIGTVGPVRETSEIFSAFIQDEIEISEGKTWLTLGAKLEDYSLGDPELLPNLRLLWLPVANTSLWGSVARAVRTPSQGETRASVDLLVLQPSTALNPGGLPIVFQQQGNPLMAPEDLIAWELGARWQHSETLTFDLTYFLNQYENLRTSQLGSLQLAASSTHLVQSLPIANGIEGDVYGIELAADWRVQDNWRIQLALSSLTADLSVNPGVNQPPGTVIADEKNTPEQLLSLRSSWTPRPNIEVDVWLRYTAEVAVASPVLNFLGSNPIDDFVSLDTHIAWRPRPNLELSLIGKNLLDEHHPEAEAEVWSTRGEVPRSLQVGLKFDF